MNIQQRTENDEQRTGGLRLSSSPLGRPSDQGCRLSSVVCRLTSGFTLVELLVVISIIAILLGIIVPTYYSVRAKAQYTKAKVTVKNLETAFKSYLDYYRVWPGALSDGTAHAIKDDVFNLLRKRVNENNNKDGIAFYEFESTNSTAALDAWSNPNDPASSNTYYWVQVDNYDNKITVGGQEIYRTVIVWSYGADRQPGADDVKSWE